jgi:hypothetical protein
MAVRCYEAMSSNAIKLGGDGFIAHNQKSYKWCLKFLDTAKFLFNL